MQESEKKRRTVRSFVRRAGRITQSQQRALDELWPVYGASYADALIAFDELFGTSRPVVLEVGFGNGESLVELAAAIPDKNFLGIEVHEPGIGHCLLRADAAGIENLRIIAYDAIDVLTHQVPPESLSRLNLYFPDWANYAEHIDEVLSRMDRLTCIERREHDGDEPLDRPQTKFERRGLRKGHRICDWCFRKGL